MEQWNQCNEAGDKTVRDLTIKHTDFGEDKTNFIISSIDTSLIDENEDGDLSGKDKVFKPINGSFERSFNFVNKTGTKLIS